MDDAQQSESRAYARRVDRALRLMGGCSRALVDAQDETSLLQDVCRVIVDVGRYRLAWVGYAQDDREKSVRMVATVGDAADYVRQLTITWSDTEQGRGPTGTAIRTGKPAVMDNIRLDPSYQPWRAEAVKHGFGSSIALPLPGADRPFGALSIYADTDHAFDRDEVEFLSELADTLAYGITTLRTRAERRETEERLRRNEELFRLITDNVEDLIAIIDLEGKRIYNSRSYARILGDHVGLRGTDSFAEIHPGDREKIRRIFLETVVSGVGKRSEYRLAAKDGSIRYIESQGSVIRDNLGSVSSVVVVSRDVTERNRAEQERSILQEQLRQAQKLESVGTLAGGVAHDFNNILTIILGYLQLLGRADLTPEKRRQLIETLNETVGRGAGLVRQLLTFARKSESLTGPMDVNAVVEELGKVIRETFPRTIVLAIQPGKDVPVILADAGQIHQALLNLCVNARDAMSGDGSLTIRTEKVPAGELRGRFNDVRDDFYVGVSISDTGAGMDEATRMRVFEPFFTTKPSGKGTGLGLAVVYGVVKNHQGFIDLKSTIGEGTTFYLYFPAPAAVPVAQKPKTDYDESPGGNETILVVEDEKVQRDLVTMLLEGKGYTTLSASDGAEAVEVYRKFKNKISLVVSDIGLPRQTGLEAFVRIKEVNPGANVIFASGYLEPNLKNDILRQGARGFIQKPYEPNEILRRIREVIDAHGKP